MIEVAARAGGSLIPQMINYSTGVDTLPWIIKSAAGDSFELVGIDEVKQKDICVANYMLHSNKSGRYLKLHFDPKFEREIGDYLHEFRDAQDGIGEMIIKFESIEQMNEMLPHIDDYVKVMVEP